MMGGGQGSSTSQYVKQELRNMCTARSSLGQAPQQQLNADPLGMDFETDGEIPADVLDSSEWNKVNSSDRNYLFRDL